MKSVKKIGRNMNHVFPGMLMGLFLSLFTFGEAEAQDTDLVAYWPMDEGSGAVIHDKTANGNNGEVYGARWVSGKIGSALEFDGVDDWVKISNFGMVAPTDEITVLAWVKLGPEIKNQDLFWFANAEGSNRITVHFPWDSVISWQFGMPFQGLTMPLPDGITGIWQHFAFAASSSGDFMKIYRNGVEVALKAGMANFERSPGDFGIGGVHNFNGTIDEVSIYRRALTASEVKALCEKGVPDRQGHKDTLPDHALGQSDVQQTSQFGADFTDIAIPKTPEHEIRFTSGKTIYVEALVGGQWVSRCRAVDGHIPPYWRIAKSSFEIQIKDDPSAGEGTLLSKGWQWVSASEVSKTDRGARHFVVELSNTIYPIGVKVHTVLDGTPVLVRWLEITNVSDKPVALTAVYPWSGGLWLNIPMVTTASGVLQGGDFTLGYQTEGRLGWFEWKPLPWGRTAVESVMGNGYDDPFFIVRKGGTKEYFICHLAWSANWQMEFERQKDTASPRASLSFKIGPLARDALRVIAPGETIKTPAVHLGHVEGDFDFAVQAMHDHLRRFVLPTRKPERSYLVQYIVGGGGQEMNIHKSIDVAAALGAELFIMDCGWWDVYGKWVPSASRLPRGLEPLVEYAHKKGLLFGLYAEVEGGRGNWSESEVFREHPDWFGPQNVLRLDRPEVAAYVESELIRLIDEYKPDLYRHDFIPVIPGYTFEWSSTLHHGFMENDYWRYYEAYYSILERIHAKYPDLILQMCSNGGTREDLDMVSRVHETYTNEGVLPYPRPGFGPVTADDFYALPPMLPPYSGKTVALPPEILVFGLRPAMEDTDLLVMFTLATPWILEGGAPSVDELSAEVRERYLHYANLYKQFIRPLWPTCRVYHHEPVNARAGVSSSPWFVMEYGASDRTKGWATLIRMGKSDSDRYLFRPKGLDPGRKYQVTFNSTGETVTRDGLQLIQDGLPIRLESVLSSELLLFEADTKVR